MGLLAHKIHEWTNPKSPSFHSRGCIPARDALVRLPSRFNQWQQRLFVTLRRLGTAGIYPIPISAEMFYIYLSLVYHNNTEYAMLKNWWDW